MPDEPETGAGQPPPYPGAGQPPPSYPQGPPSYPQGPPSYPQGPPSYPQGPPSYPQGPPSYPQGPPSYPQGPPAGGGYGGQAGQGGYGGYGPPTGGQVVYAGFWPRVGGWLIDFILILIVTSIIDIPLRNINAARVNYNTTTNGVVHHDHYSVLAGLVQIVIVLLYAGFMIGMGRGQTVGMMAISARAVDANDGSSISFWRAVGRGAFEYLMAILFFIPWIVDMLFPAWDSRRQTLHDKVARTVVVKTNAVAPPTGGWGQPSGGWGQQPPGTWGGP